MAEPIIPLDLREKPRRPVILNVRRIPATICINYAGGIVVIGAVLGFLIGIITGTVFLLILKTADRDPNKNIRSILTLTAELLALPAFWAGGPWITGAIIQEAGMEEFKNPYVVSLVLSFCAFSLYPAARWIIQLGEEFGRRR